MQMHPWKVFCLLFLALTLGLSSSASAQTSTSITIHQVDDSQFPNLTSYLTATDSSGLPLEHLTNGSFFLSEDGLAIERFSLEENPSSDLPITVMLVLDASSTMYGQPLEDTLAAAQTFLNSLNPADQVGVITFSDTVQTIAPITSDKAAVSAAIDAIEAGGASPLYDAIVQAVQTLRNLPQGRKAIIVLTDGHDDGSMFTFQEAIQEAELWSIPIYPIGFGFVNQDAILRIASLTSGYPQIQPDSASLSEAFETVRAVLRHHYVLTYTSAFPADGNQHTLSVALNHLGTQFSGSFQFTARPGFVHIDLPSFSSGMNLGGEISIAPQITAPAEVVRVSFLLDGSEFGQVFDAPYAYTWDVSAISSGPHTLSIIAADASGNQGRYDLDIHVRPAILIEWISPQAGDEISQSLLLEAEIDALAGVAGVIYYVDGAEFASLSSPPYTVEWPLDAVEAGTHTLRVVVTDANNLSSEAEIVVTVSLQSSGFILGLAVLVVIAASVILIPLARRRRKVLSSGSLLPAHLMEVEGRHPGTVWPLSSVETRIGRKQEANDIHASGLSASRSHAVIRRLEGGYILINLNPANPTFINASAVETQQRLKSGDEIRIGESLFRFDTTKKPEAQA